MTEKQIPKLVAMLVEHQKLFKALTDDDAQWVIQNTPSAIQLIIGAISKRNMPIAETAKEVASEKLMEEGLLKNFMKNMRFSLERGDFIARKNFIIDTSKKAKVKISRISKRFQEEFLDKVEEVSSIVTMLRCDDLTHDSSSGPVIKELGGEDLVETTLAEMYSVLLACEFGTTFLLLKEEWQANLFFIRNTKGELRTVQCLWDDGGWVFAVISVDDPHEWYSEIKTDINLPTRNSKHRVYSRDHAHSQV